MGTMRLPNVEQAIVARRKLTEYLLSPTHRAGRSKAAFFASFGFTAEAWETLADALKDHAAQHEVVETEQTRFGTSYSVEGALRAPDGRMPLVRAVWFIESGESVPRLVTAYPLKGAQR
jgi:hypothetical protein